MTESLFHGSSSGARDVRDLRVNRYRAFDSKKQAFRDAIESLSPEQQRFAKAFREMQLASSVPSVARIANQCGVRAASLPNSEQRLGLMIRIQICTM